MNLEERFYSESELRGKPSGNPETENLYSSYEVEEISDMFSEFYSEYADNYSDVDQAYEEFIDAYSNVRGELSKNQPSQEDMEDYQDIYSDGKKNPKKLGKVTKEGGQSKGSGRDLPKIKVGRKGAVAGAVAAGGALGYAGGKLWSKGDEAKINEIEAKMSTGTATASEIQSLTKLRRKAMAKKVGGTLLGAGSAGLAMNKAYSAEDKYIVKRSKLGKSISKGVDRFRRAKAVARGEKVNKVEPKLRQKGVTVTTDKNSLVGKTMRTGRKIADVGRALTGKKLKGEIKSQQQIQAAEAFKERKKAERAAKEAHIAKRKRQRTDAFLKHRAAPTAVAAVAGGVAGRQIGKLASRGAQREIDALNNKRNLSQKDSRKLEDLKKKVKRRKAIGTVAGALVAGGGTAYAVSNKNKVRKMFQKNK